MRFLGLGDTCDLAALYKRLAEAGHDVRVEVTEPMCRDVMAGVIEQVPNGLDHLDWVGRDGLILVENVAHGRGRLQDELRGQGYRVIGGSAYGDRLENDRGFAQTVLRELGFPTLPWWAFAKLDEAAEFVAKHPGRYVSKLNSSALGAAGTYVGRLSDGRDVAAVLRAHRRILRGDGEGVLLMAHVAGVELGVGAYFNGQDFLTPACLDWEHKRFFPGELGEMVGEMGTVATFGRSGHFFRQTLAKLAPLLRANGYCGYINLNTIVNEDGVWPLEFTCRFGYPGFAVLEPLQALDWATLFERIADGGNTVFPFCPGYSVGVVLTTRPFPYIRHYVNEPTGLPVLFEPELAEAEWRHVHLGECGLVDGEWVTAGYHGWTGVVTGTGPTISDARAAAYALATRACVPNLRYRADIGERVERHELHELERLGVFGD